MFGWDKGTKAIILQKCVEGCIRVCVAELLDSVSVLKCKEQESILRSIHIHYLCLFIFGVKWLILEGNARRSQQVVLSQKKENNFRSPWTVECVGDGVLLSKQEHSTNVSALRRALLPSQTPHPWRAPARKASDVQKAPDGFQLFLLLLHHQDDSIGVPIQARLHRNAAVLQVISIQDSKNHPSLETRHACNVYF